MSDPHNEEQPIIDHLERSVYDDFDSFDPDDDYLEDES